MSMALITSDCGSNAISSAQVEMVSDGYCIEYDFIDPRQLSPALQSELLPGLWLAGQINGKQRPLLPCHHHCNPP